MDSLVGKTLGNYQIIEELGRGGMAVVYKAYQPSLNRHVAVKVLLEHLGRDSQLVERFLREARNAAKLRHPNIIHVYDVGQQGNLYYIVMDYIEGFTLAEKLQREGAQDPPTAFSILRQVGAALDYAHSRGIVHRDVKPSNILLTTDGQAVLSDFGIARAAAESQLTTTGVAMGTAEYMSPEQAEGKELDGRSDLYSLAIVLYKMLTSQSPFRADTPLSTLYKQVHESPPAPSRLNATLPGAVDQVVLRGLQKDKNKRYSSAQEMVEALAQAISSKPQRRVVRPPEVKVPAERRGPTQVKAPAERRGPTLPAWLWPVAGVAVVGVLVILFGAKACGGQKPKPTATLQAAATATLAKPTSTTVPPTRTVPLATNTPIPATKTAVPPTATPVPAVVAPRGKLAYTENRANFEYDIYEINLDGTGKRLLVADASEPSFTRDGKQILFYDWKGNAVNIMNVDGSNRRMLIADGEAGFASVGSDGYTVVYQTGVVNWERWQWDMRIQTIGIDSQNIRMICEGDQPAWNPKAMQFVCKTCDGSKCGLFVMNADGSGRHMITEEPNDQNPSWSPDGKRIVFASNRDGNWEIYVMNADGSNQRRLTNNPTTDALPIWLPDGQYIVFRSDRDGVWAIYVMRADGTGVKKIVDAKVHPQRWRWERMAVFPQ